MPPAARSVTACLASFIVIDLAVARRVHDVARRIDRDAVAHHPPGEHRIGHLLERQAPAGERRDERELRHG